MKKTIAIILAATTLAACSEEPKPAAMPTQAEIDAANARLWQFEDKPLPKPREQKPGQF